MYMTKQLTTKARASTCRRCGDYVLAATSGGVRVTADPVPVDKAGRVAALVDNRSLYVLADRKLRPVTLDVKGLDDKTILAAHGCGCSAVDVDAFEEVLPDPPQAPVMLGRPLAGSHPAHALAGAQRGSHGLSRAESVNLRRSECEGCQKLIGDEPCSAVEFAGHVWFAYHERCTA